MDREKIVSCLTDIENIMIVRQEICPREELQYWIELQVGVAASIAMLKQEAVEPKISESYRTNSGRMSRRKAWCGACGIGINMDAKFCDHCGRAVKWE